MKITKKEIWIRTDQNAVIISSIKHKYLNSLDIPRTTKELSNRIGVCFKSANNRLQELEKLGLIERREDKVWMKLKTKKKILVK